MVPLEFLPRFPFLRRHHWPAPIGALLLLPLFFGVGIPQAESANAERKALGQFAGKYDGNLRNFLNRDTATGAVGSFIPSSPAFARIPRGKRGFRIDTEFAFRIIFFGKIKRISVRNGGSKVKYRGVFQGATSFPGGGTASLTGTGSFRATARHQGNREKLDGKMNYFDTTGGNTITTRFVGKQ